MKKVFGILYFIFISCCVVAQGLRIDTNVLGKWSSVRQPIISNNGRYFAYTVGNIFSGDTLVIRDITKSWKRVIPRGANAYFSVNSKIAVYKCKDTLFFLPLGAEKANSELNVTSCKWPAFSKGKWVAYQKKDGNRETVLLNLLDGKKRTFDSVRDYIFDNFGNSFLFETEEVEGEYLLTTLKYFNLSLGVAKTIWSARKLLSMRLFVGDLGFDREGRQIVFSTHEESGSRPFTTVWWYKVGMDSAIVKVDRKSLGSDSALLIKGPLKFSGNGRWICFGLQIPQVKRRMSPGTVKVDIWSYKDVILQPDQIVRSEREVKSFVTVVDTWNDNHVIRLEHGGERLFTTPEEMKGDYVIIADKHFEQEPWWSLSLPYSVYLVFLGDNSRRLIGEKSNNFLNFSFSPSCRYLVYYDWKRGHYFSYDIRSGKTINITAAAPTSFRREYQTTTFLPAVEPVLGWLEHDSALLLCDNYDLWKVDPLGDRLPVNITNGYGVANHIKFRLACGFKGALEYYAGSFKMKESLLLSAFNTVTKYNGFYKMKLNEGADPELLTMGPYTYYITESQKAAAYSFNDGMEPIKAGFCDSWIVERQSFDEAPNFFQTNDFKKFQRLSESQPQKNYNWLKAELITWKQLDGTPSDGILYKPQDFDPTKRYPVIFNYYRALSHRIFQFPFPDFTFTNINIPWFVSRGYLVFTPDIHYNYVVADKTGQETGKCAYNSIVSAARELAKYPFVDSNKMAIQGHSFGGGETNYLVTHTHIFAAAADAAGSSDPISAYLTLVPFVSPVEHFNKQTSTEGTYGGTPWQWPDLYKDESAVLNADKVTTPLLIMHNMKDNQIQWRQGVELYMALRRLGKKVWMLQYDNGTHGLYGKDATDYTIRLTQYFDYYLKDLSPPKWMTKGVPASMKGIDTGYELDTSGDTP